MRIVEQSEMYDSTTPIKLYRNEYNQEFIYYQFALN